MVQNLRRRTKNRFLRLGLAQPLLKLLKGYFTIDTFVTLAFSCGAPSIEYAWAYPTSLNPVETLFVLPAELLENLVRVFLFGPALHSADFLTGMAVLVYRQGAELRCVTPRDSEILSAAGADAHTLFALDTLADGELYEIVD